MVSNLFQLKNKRKALIKICNIKLFIKTFDFPTSIFCLISNFYLKECILKNWEEKTVQRIIREKVSQTIQFFDKLWNMSILEDTILSRILWKLMLKVDKFLINPHNQAFH